MTHSPRTGDRVVAVPDRRNSTAVEGILHLRHVPIWNYVQVLVIDGRGTPVEVRADTIEVLDVGVVPAEQVEATDPLREEPGRRRIKSLEQARQLGLLRPSAVRTDLSWDDLFDLLDTTIEPLLVARWVEVGREQEESWEYGDSVTAHLERHGRLLEIEVYEDRYLLVWPGGPSEDPDGISEPLARIDELTVEALQTCYGERGLL